MRFAIPFAFIAFTVTACGGDDAPDNDPFATYQDCFDEHHVTEGFDAPKAVTICCLDHPIGSSPMNVVCGDTEQSCETYVDANLSSTSATASDITAGCTDYITQRGM